MQLLRVGGGTNRPMALSSAAPQDPQTATNCRLQASTTGSATKNCSTRAPKTMVKNGCPFYTINYCSYPRKGELSLSARKVSTPSPQSTHLPSPPKTWSVDDSGPCRRRKPAIHKSQAPDFQFLSTTRKYSEDMALGPIHAISESTPAHFWPQYLQLHRGYPPASAFYVQTIRH